MGDASKEVESVGFVIMDRRGRARSRYVTGMTEGGVFLYSPDLDRAKVFESLEAATDRLTERGVLRGARSGECVSPRQGLTIRAVQEVRNVEVLREVVDLGPVA